MLAVIEPHVVILRLPSIVTGVEYLLEQGDLGGCRREDKVWHSVEAVQLCNDFKGVPLRSNQFLMSRRNVPGLSGNLVASRNSTFPGYLSRRESRKTR